MTKIVTKQSRKTGAGGAFVVAALLMAVAGFAKWGPGLARIQDAHEREWKDQQRRIEPMPRFTPEQVEQLDKSAGVFLENLNRDIEERRKAREAEESKPIETPAPSAPSTPEPLKTPL